MANVCLTGRRCATAVDVNPFAESTALAAPGTMAGRWCGTHGTGGAMYLPPHFAETDPGAIADIIEAAPLACVVAQTEEGWWPTTCRCCKGRRVC